MNTTAKFQALIGLAQSDGQFDSSEKNFIRVLAERQGMSLKELKEQLMKSDKSLKTFKELDFEEKVDILIHLIKLMKIDGKVLISEINYCDRMARLLGFEEKAVGYLSGIIEGNLNVTPNYGGIRHRMRKYLV